MGRLFRLSFCLAALAAPSLAHATCPSANEYSFLFNSQAAATLNYANSYTYTATNPSAQSLNFNVSFLTDGLTSSVIASTQMPTISTLINDDNTSRFLVVGGIFAGRTPDISVNTRVVVTTFTFPTPVRDVTITTSDIDFTLNQFRDWFMAVGRNGANSYVPMLTTPFGQVNNTGPYTNATSSLTLGPVATPFAVTAAQGVGTGSSPNTNTTGDIILTFPQPVTSVEVRYGNYPLQGTETATGQQGIGIKGVSFCPMPVIALAKDNAVVSDPVNGITDPKMIPGADVDYTITIANSGGSPVDLNATVINDLLPADVTFFNGDIDAGTAGVQNFVFTPNSSGLTLGTGNITYFDAGNASITPSAGYDTNVRTVRWSPQGTMAANSSATIRFRTQIK
jgi:uncharacterized repeat protein (TIGR01451 family)